LAGAALGSLAEGMPLRQSLNVQILPTNGIPVAIEYALRSYEIVQQIVAETRAPIVGAILLIPELNTSTSNR
jgi:hypothetical protein